jgi:ATP-dependent protease ClpP protease subunit
VTKLVQKPKPNPAQAQLRPWMLTEGRLRADARVLDGAPSRVARAAVDDEDTGEADDQGTVGELWLYGVVGGWWRGFDAESVANALRNLDVDTLHVRIHSPGGHASDGIAISNLLRNHKARVVIIVDGLAASAASVIAVAGDEIIMCPGSQMMLHDASTFGIGNAGDLRRAADWIDGQSQNYAGVYQYRAGGTVQQWRDVMLANEGDGTWYTAEEAVAAGLADSVGTRTAVGSPPVAPEDDLDDEDTWARAAHDVDLLEHCVHPVARAAWRGERAPKPPTASAGGTTPTHEGSSAVAFSTEQITEMRTKLGLAEDADEATILAALDEALDERAEPQSTAGGVPEGHVVVPQARLADLVAGAAAGTEALQKLQALTTARHNEEREAFLDANKAKYAKSNRGAWAKEYDRDPEGTRKHFAEAPDLIPANEFGHEVDDDVNSEAVATVRESTDYQNWRM